MDVVVFPALPVIPQTLACIARGKGNFPGDYGPSPLGNDFGRLFFMPEEEDPLRKEDPRGSQAGSLDAQATEFCIYVAQFFGGFFQSRL